MSKSELINKIENLTDTLESFVESKDLYILMIDLCDSTEIKQFCLDRNLPESFWIIRQKIFLARTAKIIRQYNGYIVKTIGDEIMAIFEIDVSPINIIKCCTEVFQIFEGLKQYNKGKFKINSKASIDFGNCVNGDILENASYDPIGTCVDRCARISKYANQNEIVFSEDFYETLQLKNNRIYGYDMLSLSENIKGLGNINFYKLHSNKV